MNEFKNKYENQNCLGTITFFNDNYISDSTKEELSVIYKDNQYSKHNMMISLVSFDEMDSEKILRAAISNQRISIDNAFVIKPILSGIIKQVKEKTIHRYGDEKDIPFLAKKLEKLFAIRTVEAKSAIQKETSSFVVCDGILHKYIGKDSDVVIPKGVTEIGEGAFSSCLDVTSVVIPECVTTIHAYAFNNCISLEKITISKSVLVFGIEHFSRVYHS